MLKKFPKLLNLFSLQVVFSGNPGHGSRFIENTAVEKMQKLLNRALGYREEQRKRCVVSHVTSAVSSRQHHHVTSPLIII